jgi:hypothetical protein
VASRFSFAPGRHAMSRQRISETGRSREPGPRDAAIREFLDGLAEMIADFITDDQAQEGDKAC